MIADRLGLSRKLSTTATATNGTMSPLRLPETTVLKARRRTAQSNNVSRNDGMPPIRTPYSDEKVGDRNRRAFEETPPIAERCLNLNANPTNNMVRIAAVLIDDRLLASLANPGV